MNGSSSEEEFPSRFTPYTNELREVFASHGMESGNAEDILSLAGRLALPGPIQDETTSLVRSIIFREHEAIPRVELVKILVVAIAGSPMAEPSPEIQVALHQLEAYVGDIVASLRRRSFAEDEVETEVEEAGFPPEETQVQELPPAALGVQEPAIEGEANQVFIEAHPAEPLADPVVSSRESTQVMDAPQGGFPPKDDPIASTPLPVQLQVRAASEIQAVVPVSKASPRRRAFAWAAGFCVLFLLGLALFLARRPGAPAPMPAGPSVAAVPDASAPVVAPVVPVESHSADAPAAKAANPAVAAPALSKAKPSAAGPTIHPAPAAPPSQLHATLPLPSAGSTPAPAAPAPAPASPKTARRARPPAAGQNGPAARPPAPAVAARGAGSFLVSSGVMDGNLITIPTTPKYPKMANMAGIEGRVILQAVISRNGTVVAADVLEGHRLLRGSAVKAVRSWRYRPYLVRGKPADVATVVIVDFHLPH